MSARPRPVRPGADAITVSNARTHNLRDVSCSFPVGALTVVTGPSGSGKSSLAFDTLYAEGQRRFVESMSTYARQYLERLERPDVDEITHVLPAIAIEQKAPARSARSTVGTATEILDVLRLLFSAAGTLRCPDDGSLVRRETPETVRAALLEAFGEGARLLVVAPRKVTSFEAESAEWRRLGFYRCVGAAGDVREISSSGKEKEEEPGVSRMADVKGRRPLRGARSAPLTSDIREEDLLPSAAASAAAAYEKGIPSPFPLLIGRHVLHADDPELLSSLSQAFDAGDGELLVLKAGEGLASARRFRRGLACNACGRAFADPVPALFSFNSPRGACETCQGFGRVVGIDAARVIPDGRKTLRERPIAPFNSPSYESAYEDLRAASRRLKIRWDVPWDDLTPRERDAVWKGSGDWYGVEGLFRYLEKKRYKVHVRVLLSRYRGYATCPACRGARLRPEALAVTVGGRTIAAVSDLTLDELVAFFGDLPLGEGERERAASLVEEVTRRARTLVEIGLGYVTLARTMRTLSGGEAQRVQLGSAIGNALTGTLYVLDEPTVGLHPRDTRRLLSVLRRLAAAGNAVVAVEHDTDVIRAADHVVDLGPGAGAKGGRLAFEGTPLALEGRDTATGRSLKKEKEVFLASESVGVAALEARPSVDARGARSSSGPHSPSKKIRPVGALPSPLDTIQVLGARANNLKNLSVSFPLHRLVAVAGVSGSGKSSLVVDVLAAGARQRLGKGLLAGIDAVGEHDAIEGLERVADVVLVDQSPLGRSSRSNPATVTKAWDEIRTLLARVPAARSRRLEKGAFSFNAAGGRCERCEGAGVVTVDMQFLADVTVVCDVCDGRRFKPEVLEVRLRGRNVDELLATTVDEARILFADAPRVADRLAPLAEAGLGYLTLGQPTATLSGGEAQRLKIASFLRGADAPEAPVLFVFDEPTTGLAPSDVDVLLAVLRRLIAAGHSIVAVEHNAAFLARADHLIELGPDGGPAGGRIVFEGAPAALAARGGTPTAVALEGRVQFGSR
ncbi:MAG TPA: excinuclease ABC subunit UvrA [Thermoanaerobaculia bacterium]|nr:excinuclease ABC subunit UvrA [Thermoanaerobaculia bacterium]